MGDFTGKCGGFGGAGDLTRTSSGVVANPSFEGWTELGDPLHIGNIRLSIHNFGDQKNNCFS